MDLGLKGKVVVIAGGSTGIGLESALTFGAEGASVAIGSRSEAKLAGAQEAMDKAGYTTLTKAVDMTNRDSVQAFADAVIAKFGRIDIWVNCAGDNVRKPLWGYTEEDFDHIVDACFKSAWLGSVVAGEQMKKQGGGVIVNISSGAARVGIAGRSLYACNKAAVSMLTRMLAGELAAWNIRVNAIEPGTVTTKLASAIIPEDPAAYEAMMSGIPMRRLGTVSEIAGPVVFVASDRCSYMTGETVLVNGGKNAVNNPGWSQDAKEGNIKP